MDDNKTMPAATQPSEGETSRGIKTYKIMRRRVVIDDPDDPPRFYLVSAETGYYLPKA
jgi:hypothetical protein